MDTRICIITGANSGIGKEAARLICEARVHVVMACRNKDRANRALQDILSQYKEASIETMIVDMSDRASIEAFVEQFSARHNRLDILIHNAADFDISRTRPVHTHDGIESVWATNHVGVVALTEKLMSLLMQSDAARIITISSKGLAVLPCTKVNIDDCEFTQRRYSVAKAYYQSKMAQEMYTMWLADQLSHTPVTVNCIRVGAVQLDLDRYPDLPLLYKKVYALKRKFSMAPETMARIYAQIALQEQYAHVNGTIFDEHGMPIKHLKKKYSPPKIEAVMALTKRYL